VSGFSNSRHPIAVARRTTRHRLEGRDDAGFTLIELIIVVAILPIVVGGIAVALLSVFGLQNQTNNRVGDSNDELYSSTTFNKDVQSAEQIETVSTPACGSAEQTQLLGLQWALNSAGTYTTVVSYVTVPVTAPNGTTTTSLVRQICTSGASTTPTQTRVISHDVGSPTLTFNPTGFIAIPTSWQSTHGLYGVTMNITAPGSTYTYTLSGLPSAGSSTGQVSQINQQPNPAGCNLASLGTGTYANVLCFADFSSFTDPSAATGCQQMNLSIADSPDFLQFCVIATPRNTVRPQSIPTYYDPGGSDDSEAYLGNNGFYTGIAGQPALSQRSQPNFCTNNCTFTGTNGANTVITFTNIEVTNAVGQPVTNWTLVTGDAESTDTNGWLEFQNSSVNWSILPNTASSLWGNSCYDGSNPNNQGVLQWTGPAPTAASVGTPSNGPPSAANATTLAIGAAPTYATSAKGILCESDTQLNKTGALMVAAPEPANSSAPQNVTVTLQGEGYQAIFLGVLL
jgi:prepilin-type N-terminal cleavage/methylation domain-containing protein